MMNTASVLDWILVCLLAVSTIAGLMTGFLRTLVGLAGLVLGIVFAGMYYERVAQNLVHFIPSLRQMPYLPELLAFLVLVLAVAVVASILGRVLRGAVHAVGLGFVDRLFGGLFGVARGILLGVVLMMALGASAWSVVTPSPDGTKVESVQPPPALLRESRLAPYFLSGAHALSFLVPDRLAMEVRDVAERYKHSTTGWIKP